LIVLDAPAAVSIFLNVGREAGRIRVAEKRTFGALSVGLSYGEVRVAYDLGLRECSYFYAFGWKRSRRGQEAP